MTPGTPRWDIFCSVVDNYGDAGICWRLARQLVAEHALDVRLWIDALPILAKLAPAIDPARSTQLVDGVCVARWAEAERAVAELPATVVQAFGCALPHRYLAAMAARKPQPVWINLEYLSAEAWIEDCHGLASRHPKLPLTRHFFFPGFTAASGGLLRERDLVRRRDAFLADAAAQAVLWRSLRHAAPDAGTRLVSLFCYPGAPLASLLDAWAEGDEPILCIVPEGVAASALDAWTGGAVPHAGQEIRRGRLTIAEAPFLPQDDYDRLLWRCDLNFVRGEDSFVRAQWAARSFVWQLYPQTEDAHRLKLDAFLERYSAGLASEAARAYRDFARTWNGDGDPAVTWEPFAAAAPLLAPHAQRWAAELAQMSDLASNLVKFAAGRV
jgi:uncharacterized repeat protein (TIGR03837 family)